jgi:hypothetical protein
MLFDWQIALAIKGASASVTLHAEGRCKTKIIAGVSKRSSLNF